MEFESSLRDLGWTDQRQHQLEEMGDPTLRPARIAAEHRGAYVVAGTKVGAARLAGRFRRGEGDWPAVGDWAAVHLAAGLAVIERVLPRTTLLSRRRPGLPQPQVIAANVDVVLVVTAPGADLSPRRIERYLAAVHASGAWPLVVLNKADLAPDLPAVERVVSAVAGGCLATSALDGRGLDQLRAQLPPRGTAVLVGSSGVGKSSLLNALLGGDRQVTRSVRLRDDKGRHTTSRRELLPLPGGGWAIDTPGMREFGLWEAGEAVDQTFEEIGALARGCRFRDCRHQGEPGCAVAKALSAGLLAGERLASLEKLRREEAYQERQRDPRTQDRTKRRWKEIHKAARARRRVDPKLRDD